MKILVDKLFIKKLNEYYNLDLTYSSFKKFYIEVVKVARDKDPEVLARRKSNEISLDLFLSMTKDI